MDRKLIEEINEKTAIVDLVSEFIGLSKAGKNFKGLCPFHQEKTPSFMVSPEKNIAKCMSCGEGGSPINFYRKIKNISLDEAAYELAKRAGIEVKENKTPKDPYANFYRLMKEVAHFYQFNLNHSEKGIEALKYLQTRQLDDEMISHFMIGYAPPFSQTLYQVLKDKGFAVSDMINLGVVKQGDDGAYYDLFSDRIIFPITDPRGNVVGLSGRTMNKNESAKYINSPETVIFKKGQLLYHYAEGLSEIRKTKQVILYEGFFDVISSYAAGIKQGVATMGTALTKDQAKLIKLASPSMIIAYDGDTAGIKAAHQAIPVLEKEQLKVEVLTIPEQMDPDEFIKSYGPEKYEMLFGEYTQDAYQFRYNSFKLGKNMQNANDVKEFKKQVMSMIAYADASIKALYTQKLSSELGIQLEDLVVKTKTKPNDQIIPKIEKPKIRNKNEMAERFLIFAMLRSRKACEMIQSQLKQTDFADHLAASIRMKIEQFYEDNLELSVEDLLDTLTSDQRDFMEINLLTDYHWISQMPVKEEEIKDYAYLVKEANLRRRYAYLKDKMEKDDDFNDQTMKEVTDILKQLKHIK